MTDDGQKLSWPGRALMAVGLGGAAFAALCCFAPFLVAGLVSAIVFLGVAGLGLYLARRKPA